MKLKATLEQDKIRNVPGWENNAPVPICMGGDYRALTFCCKPGYSLTFGFKCRRDETLKELGITPEEFIKIKEEFSKQNNWDSEVVCFGSLSYCCMRRGGCPHRDYALSLRYPEKTKKEFMKIYFQKKKELAKIILQSVQDPICKEKIKPYLELFD
ncbi:MAG: methanogenesis marker 9 domain-containing protein [Promethearchaeota archaeon]|nr:MAG: methanogenesis marker 9 domain-containing protein [Candidatus Lokiarchaeota archaeon]